jgi:hypothetical protein
MRFISHNRDWPKDRFFAKFAERNSGTTTEKVGQGSAQTYGFASNWQQLWRGPAAVSAYVSITIQVGCTALSAFVSRDLECPSLYILLINLLICVLIMD